ncbi:hypothetical protein GCM10027448_08430 [Nocardioides dilutus]
MVGWLAVGLLVAGCGGDDPPSSGPSPSEPTAPTGSVSSEATPTEPTATEPTATEPTVVPASGLLLKEETSQVNAPAGEWERIPDIVTYASAAGHVPTTQVISLSDRENYATELSLDEQVRYHNRSLPKGAIIERQPDVLLDGAPAYYVQWRMKGDTKIQHDVGLDHQGRVIQVRMAFDAADPAAYAALVASVLASFRWR